MADPTKSVPDRSSPDFDEADWGKVPDETEGLERRPVPQPRLRRHRSGPPPYADIDWDSRRKSLIEDPPDRGEDF